MRRLFAMISVLALVAGVQAAAPAGPRTVMVDQHGVLTAPTNFWSTNVTGIATALAPWLGGGALTNVTLLTHGATNELLPNALVLTAGSNVTLSTNDQQLVIAATITGGTGTVTHETGALTLNDPVLGAGGSDLKSVDANAFRQAIGMEIGVDIQAWDADLADLSDGELSGSKIGEGIDAAHITAGLLDVARLSSAVTLDAEWNSSAEISAAVGDDKVGTGKLVFDQSPVLTTPQVDNLINMQHAHTNAQSGGLIVEASVGSNKTGTGKFVFQTDPQLLNSLTLLSNTVQRLAIAPEGNDLVFARELDGETGFSGGFLRIEGDPSGPTNVLATLPFEAEDGISTPGPLLVTDGLYKTGTGKVVYDTMPELTSPTIGSFVNAQHIHNDADTGGQLGPGALNATQTYSMAGLNAGAVGVTNDVEVGGELIVSGGASVTGDLTVGAVNVLPELVSKARSAGVWDFYDDFERADTAAGVLGTSSSGFAWQFADPSGGSYPGTNAAIRSGRLVPNHKTDAPKIFYATAQIGAHKAQATRIGAEVVWSDLPGSEASQASIIIAGQTNSGAASWGVHSRFNRSGWALGYIDGDVNFVDLASGTYAGGSTLAIGVPHYVEISIDPQGASATFAGEHVRVESTNFWHFAMNTTADRNWVIFEHYSNDVDDMTDLMEFESVWAGGSLLPPTLDGTLELLSGRDVTGSGGIVLSNAPALRDPTVLGTLSATDDARFDRATITNDLTVLGEVDVTGEVTAANLNAGSSVSAQLVTTSNLVATGTVDAAAVTTDALAIDGAVGDPTSIGSPLVLFGATTNDYGASELIAQWSTNGTAQSAWSKEVPDNSSLGLNYRYIGAGFSNALADDILYAFWRTNGGSAALASTNHVGGVTNVWAELDGNTAHLYVASPLATTMRFRGTLDWWIEQNGAESVAPLVLGPIDFEETGAPGAPNAPYTSSQKDYDYSTDPLEGSESVSVGTAGAAGYVVWDISATSGDVYVAARVRGGVGVDSGTQILSLRNGTTTIALAKTKASTSYVLRCRASGGSESADSGTLNTNATEFSYVMLRGKTGTGSNAEAEVWITDDAGAGWGTSKTSTDGTGTADINRVWIEKSNATPEPFIFDMVCIDTNLIDISRLTP